MPAGGLGSYTSISRLGNSSNIKNGTTPSISGLSSLSINLTGLAYTSTSNYSAVVTPNENTTFYVTKNTENTFTIYNTGNIQSNFDWITVGS
jgi:hypothetical protein